ncbi:MAG TPA: hypothetical protein VEC36_05395 [Patescibacteria group bacterium]|nr:hypothetical protein [Patescibacteria group bacterium]
MVTLKISFRKQFFLALALFACGIVPVFAQESLLKNDDTVLSDSESPTVGVQAGLALELGLPRNEFRENINNPGFGIGGHIAVAPHAAPIMYGVEFNYLMYGYENESVPFNNSSVGRVNVDLETTNSIVTGHFLMRLQPKTGMLRPYIDALAGFNYLSTSSSIEDDLTNHPIAQSINFQDGAFSYGGGAGVMFELTRGEIGEDEKGNQQFGSTLLDFRVRYMRGGEAEYLRKGSIKEDPNDPAKAIYDVYTSRTDMLTFQIGVAISL